jgi:hypothetical protein
MSAPSCTPIPCIDMCPFLVSQGPRHMRSCETDSSMAVWALIYTLSSMALGWVLKRAFKFPAYTLPAIAFNNTTALPLLLIQSLETSGILDNLTMGGNDTASAVSVGLQGSCILFCILTPNYDRLAHRRLFSLTRLLFSYLSLTRALFSLLRIHLRILGSLSLGNYRSRAP